MIPVSKLGEIKAGYYYATTVGCLTLGQGGAAYGSSGRTLPRTAAVFAAAASSYEP